MPALLDDGADVLDIDPELDDDEPDDEELGDEVDVVPDVDVVVLDAPLEARPAYVCSASTPRPATASTALVTVERSTRLRSRSARSRRAAAGVSRGLCDACCEELPFMRSTVRPPHGIPMQATWEAAGN